MTRGGMPLVYDGWQLCCTGGPHSFKFHFDQFLHYIEVDHENEYTLRDFDAYIFETQRECVIWEKRPGYSVWSRPKEQRKENKMKEFRFILDKALDPTIKVRFYLKQDSLIKLCATDDRGYEQILAAITSDGKLELFGLGEEVTEKLGIKRDRTGTISIIQ